VIVKEGYADLTERGLRSKIPELWYCMIQIYGLLVDKSHVTAQYLKRASISSHDPIIFLFKNYVYEDKKTYRPQITIEDCKIVNRNHVNQEAG